MKRSNLEKWFWGTGVCLMVAFYSGVPPLSCDAATLEEALTGGTPSLNLRYRFERVDAQGASHDANAGTLRTALGYQTGDFMNFSARVEFEDVRPLGFRRFNSTSNGKTEYPVVADPEDTEINQAFLSYLAAEKTNIVVGRQRIILDNQRFIGNVGWRQNEQTYDGLMLHSGMISGVEITYAYVENVNRIFGEHHPVNSDFKMRSHLVNLAYSVSRFGKVGRR